MGSCYHRTRTKWGLRMLKYVVPVLVIGGGIFIWSFNQNNNGTLVLLPFLDAIPQLTGDLPAQADWTWRAIVGLGGLVFLVTLVSDLRERNRRGDSDQS